MAQIDDASVIAAANICDTSTTYVVGGQTYVRPLYTAGYAYSCDAKPFDGLTNLCQAMGGDLVYADGMLRIWAGSYSTPIPLTLDETWLTDDQAVAVQPAPPRLSLVNSITATIADQYQAYRPVPLTPISPPAYVVEDGSILPQAVAYLAVTFAGQAQYISSCALRRDRQGLTLTVSCNLRAWQVQRFDVLPVSLARFGWVNKPFEVIEATWREDAAIQLTLKETAADIWAMDAGFSAADIAPNTNLPVPWGLQYPSNLAATSDNTTIMLQPDGTVVPRISITWDPITDSRILQGGSVEIRYWRMGDSIDSFHSVRAQGTDTQVYLTDITAGLSYLITARCNSVIAQSEWSPMFSVGAGGKSGAPSNVAGAAYALGAGRVHLSWTPCTDIDYKLTEVRVGASWAAGTAITARAEDSYDWLKTTAGTYTLWFAHKNWSGIYSATPASLSVTVDSTVLAPSASGVNTILGNLNFEADGPSPVSAGITFKTDGTLDIGGNWYLGGAPGATYYVRFDQLIGPSVSGTLGTALALTSNQSVSITRSSLGRATASVLYGISDASGTQIAGGILTLTAVASS